MSDNPKEANLFPRVVMKSSPPGAKV